VALVRALASVAVALHHYRSDIAFLEADARASSRATQQSERAAHASAFVAYLLVAAMQRFDASKANEEGEYDWSAYDAREDRRAEMCGGVMTESLTFLTDIAEEYEERLEETDRATQASANPASSHAVHSLRRLLRASEPEGSPDQCWNWRGPQLVLGGSVTKGRHTDRGRRTGAFGTNCLDGLAMALHAIAATTSYSAAIERCVNMRGASNATGALCGQIAGAMYGYRAIHPTLRACLQPFDDGHTALRAALLIRRATADEQTSEMATTEDDATMTARSQSASPFIATAESSGPPSATTLPALATLPVVRGTSSANAAAPDAQLACPGPSGVDLASHAVACEGAPDALGAERIVGATHSAESYSAESQSVELCTAELQSAEPCSPESQNVPQKPSRSCIMNPFYCARVAKLLVTSGVASLVAGARRPRG